MAFDYTTAASIARHEAIHTETLRDFAHSARQTWDELQLSKRENISLRREIRNLLGELDVLKKSLLEAEAAPQPVLRYTPAETQSLIEIMCPEQQHLVSAGKGGEQDATT